MTNLKIKSLNHITLNSGHIRISTPDDIDKSLFFYIHNLFKQSLSKDGVSMEVYGRNYIIKSTVGNIGYLITLFGKVDNELVPVLTTGCSTNDTGELWQMMHSTSQVELKTKSTDMPPLPYIADRIEPGSFMFMDALKWTGDFSKCMGWICLVPKEITG